MLESKLDMKYRHISAHLQRCVVVNESIYNGTLSLIPNQDMIQVQCTII